MLVVGVNGDESVRELKGEGRPVMNEARARRDHRGDPRRLVRHDLSRAQPGAADRRFQAGRALQRNRLHGRTACRKRRSCGRMAGAWRSSAIRKITPRPSCWRRCGGDDATPRRSASSSSASPLSATSSTRFPRSWRCATRCRRRRSRGRSSRRMRSWSRSSRGVKAIPRVAEAMVAVARSPRRSATFADSRAAIDFQGLIKSALIARASGARDRYGFARDVIREKPAAWFVNRHVDDRSIEACRRVERRARARVRACDRAACPKVDFAPFAQDACGELARFDQSHRPAAGSGKAGKAVAGRALRGAGEAHRQRRARRLGPGRRSARARDRRRGRAGDELSRAGVPPRAARGSSSAPTPARCTSPRRSARRSSASTARPIRRETDRTASSIASSSRSRRRSRCRRSPSTTSCA